MNKKEAITILKHQLDIYRARSYKELLTLIGSPQIIEIENAGGSDYLIEIQIFWDDPRDKKGNLRVIASIDDGKFFTALSPISDDFIISPDNRFVGE